MSAPPPPFPPMSAGKAQDVARTYKAFADQMTEFGLPHEARLAMRDSRWWLAYSVALAQTGKGGSDDQQCARLRA